MNLTLTIDLETAAQAGLILRVGKGRYDGETVLALLRQQIEQAGPFSGNLRALGAHKGAGGSLCHSIQQTGSEGPRTLAIGRWTVGAPAKGAAKDEPPLVRATLETPAETISG